MFYKGYVETNQYYIQWIKRLFDIYIFIELNLLVTLMSFTE